MRRQVVTGIIIAAMVATIGLLAPQPADPPPAAGMEFFTVKYGAWGLARVRVLRFDPQEFELRLLRPGRDGNLARVSLMPGCQEALACFNGSFFKEEGGEPLGLMVSGSVLLQPLRSVSWGVFWVDPEGIPHISRRDDFERRVDPTREVSFAIQSGPTILLKGTVKKKDSKELARRTSIGIDDHGRIIVLVANFPVKLAALAEFAKARLGATDLMNLDGGSSTQLIVRGSPNQPKVLGFPVAVGVGVYPRPAIGATGGETSKPAATK
jgi:uncharacterized protein YigE (DUF2233 family)